MAPQPISRYCLFKGEKNLLPEAHHLKLTGCPIINGYIKPRAEVLCWEVRRFCQCHPCPTAPAGRSLLNCWSLPAFGLLLLPFASSPTALGLILTVISWTEWVMFFWGINRLEDQAIYIDTSSPNSIFSRPPPETYPKCSKGNHWARNCHSVGVWKNWRRGQSRPQIGGRCYNCGIFCIIERIAGLSLTRPSGYYYPDLAHNAKEIIGQEGKRFSQ